MLIAESGAMRELLEIARTIAPSSATVLITGETGCGKGTVARAIHRLSPRGERPFVHVNCAALPNDLLECELFGVERGAFTDATQRAGRFEQATTGTIFLDELGDMSLSLQAKLLRVLDTREFERVGGTSTLTTDARIVAATNRDLDALRRQRKFRDDLFFRLNVVWIYVPPLRDRTEDLDAFCDFFLQKHAIDNGKRSLAFTAAGRQRLRAYYWPGNVREVENCIQRAVLLARHDQIDAVDLLLPETMAIAPLEPSDDAVLGPTPVTLPPVRTLTEAEREAIARALSETRGNRTQAARLLGISVRGLQNKMKRHGLS